MAVESYKPSCPFCGQHIEYTAGYCGRQMQCPSCGNTITFPALPPSRRGQSLHLNRPAAKPARQWSWQPPAFLLVLRDFPHWKIVAQCALPFLIIAALLYGANFVRNKTSDTPAAPTAPVFQADPNAWQRMTDLTRADSAVQARLNEVGVAVAALRLAQRVRDDYEHKSAPQDTRNVAAHTLDMAQQKRSDAQRRFEAAFEQYEKLGGTMDYRSRLPKP